MKYDCPAPSKYGKDLPLWKTATTCFLRIVKECTSQLKIIDTHLPDERVEGIWRQILDVFRGGILADWYGKTLMSLARQNTQFLSSSFAESFPLDVQEAEENFDLALIGSLEIDVVPHLGGPRIPDVVVAELGKILQRGSKLYDGEHLSHPDPRTGSSSIPVSALQSQNSTVPPLSPAPQVTMVNIDVNYPDLASTDFGHLLLRERFSYWCFDLLFLICSNITRGE
jgi:hypothetical protein